MSLTALPKPESPPPAFLYTVPGLVTIVVSAQAVPGARVCVCQVPSRVKNMVQLTNFFRFGDIRLDFGFEAVLNPLFHNDTSLTGGDTL
jgi:hypothetical protein